MTNPTLSCNNPFFGHVAVAGMLVAFVLCLFNKVAKWSDQTANLKSHWVFEKITLCANLL